MVNRLRQPLFVRHPQSPILRAAQWPYRVHSAFNPGAVLLESGSTLLLCRMEEPTGLSHLSVARSTNGIDSWVIDRAPSMTRDPERHPEERWGLADARITYVAELGRHVIAYTAFGEDGAGVALALTTDFHAFERIGLAFQPPDAHAALLARRIGERFAIVHRPRGEAGGDLWISYSSDLRSWGGHEIMLRARGGRFWDGGRIDVSSPPIETAKGWLMLYRGARERAPGTLARIGAARFDRACPNRCIARGASWIFGPEELYEMEGEAPYVVAPCGMTCSDGDTLHLYYGAADACVGLAVASITEILAWLDEPVNVVA
jgi:predicted GH43/DUF377 family glycosyl hydrolase